MKILWQVLNFRYSSFPALDESLLVLPMKSKDYQLDLMAYSPQIKGNLLRSQAEKDDSAEVRSLSLRDLLK